MVELHIICKKPPIDIDLLTPSDQSIYMIIHVKRTEKDKTVETAAAAANNVDD